MVRKWILDALYAVIVDQAYSSLYLKQHLHEVDKKDQALATTIFYGTLRNYLYCLKMWQQFANGNKVNRKIKILLTMSVYQLLFLKKVPSYAIISEAVQITKKIRPQAAGFVNAILRKVDKNPVLSFKNEIEEISITFSLPEWLVKMWISQYGQEKALNFAKASAEVQFLSVRRNVMKEKVPCDRLIEIHDPIYQYTGKALEYDPLYQNGSLSPQDLGAYQIVEMLDPQEGESILDVCAAPGTKTMAMAEKMNGTGQIMALDLHAHRVQLIENDKKRLGFGQIMTLEKDARNLDDLPLYDRVLCDVPCSGYGTLARKPDIKIHMDSGTMDTLIPLQYDILCQAANHVKEEGILVYSTCTLNKKENEKQVERFLKEHENFSLLEQKTIEPSGISNGFFAAKLKHGTI